MITRFEKFSYAISEIHHYLHKISADEMQNYGLKGPYAVYLTALYRYEEGITAARLCEVCRRNKADVSRAMAAMEEQGLVKKEYNGNNVYRALLKLTDKGVEAAEHVRERACAAVAIVGNGLTDDRREVFYDALELIVSNLQSISKNGIPEKE